MIYVMFVIVVVCWLINLLKLKLEVKDQQGDKSGGVCERILNSLCACVVFEMRLSSRASTVRRSSVTVTRSFAATSKPVRG